MDYPDIKPLFIQLGIPSSGKNSEGEDSYTCPAIQIKPKGGSAPIFVADSLKIVEFLEDRYPDTPAVLNNPNFPKETQLKTIAKVRPELILPLYPLIVHCTFHHLPERSLAYFRLTRERMLGRKIEELCSDEETLESYRRTAKKKFSEFLAGCPNFGSYVLGNRICYADMVLASTLMWIRCIAREELWSKVKEWDDGKWEKYLNSFEENGYAKVY